VTITYRGKTQSIAAWAREVGLNPATLRYRIRESGLPMHVVMQPGPLPLGRRDAMRIEHDGRSQTVQQWADEVGMSVKTLRWRLKSGWTVARALGIPDEELTRGRDLLRRAWR